MSSREERAVYRKIIVPVDIAQWEKGDKILTKAQSLLDVGGEIVLLTVVEHLPSYLAIDIPHDIIDGAVEEGRTKLAALAASVGPGVTTQLRVGSPAHEILAVAVEQKADLIIIASHIPDFSNYLIGATADRVVRHARCAVLVDR
nr:universal stress protein [Agrobacterium vitis]